MSKLRDIKRFFSGLNSDDSPAFLKEGEFVDGLNVRVAGSNQQGGVGNIETLQGEIPVLFDVVAEITYYGDSIGGDFFYSGYEEVLINGKVWMKKNWDYAYPGSKAYDDDDDNADVYGRLYTHDQIMAADFCPPGWHVPTEAEWDELLTYLGGVMIAGGKLKETGLQHWQTPNTDSSDIAAFTGLPAGKYDAAFSLLEQYGMFWMVEDGVPTPPVAINGSAATPDSFVANWLAVADATGYYLDVAEDAAFTVLVTGWNNKDVGNALYDTITGLVANTQYFYRVRAYNEVGTSENSNTQSVLTGVLSTTEVVAMTSKVGIVTVRLAGSGSLDINWGDGIIETKTLGAPTNYTHEYIAAGPKAITITNPAIITYISCMSEELTFFSVPAICTGLRTVVFSDNLLATFITHTEWTQMETFACDFNELISLVIPSTWDEIIILNLDNNKLTTFVAHPEWIDLQHLQLQVNDITSDADINDILIACEATVMGAGNSISIQDGTNAAPTGAGIVAKNNLIAAGVTVTTN